MEIKTKTGIPYVFAVCEDAAHRLTCRQRRWLSPKDGLYIHGMHARGKRISMFIDETDAPERDSVVFLKRNYSFLQQERTHFVWLTITWIDI